jgi:hypothetical protein
VLGQGGVGAGGDLGTQRRVLRRPDQPRPPRARRRGRAAGRRAALLPPRDGGPVDAEGAGGLRLGEPGVDGAQAAVAEVGRVLLHERASSHPEQLLRKPL